MGSASLSRRSRPARLDGRTYDYPAERRSTCEITRPPLHVHARRRAKRLRAQRSYEAKQVGGFADGRVRKREWCGVHEP